MQGLTNLFKCVIVQDFDLGNYLVPESPLLGSKLETFVLTTQIFTHYPNVFSSLLHSEINLKALAHFWSSSICHCKIDNSGPHLFDKSIMNLQAEVFCVSQHPQY